MKIKVRPKKLIVPVLNALAVTGIIVTSVAGQSAAKAQQYNYTAEKWKGITDEDFSQASCYFADDSGFDTGRIRSARGSLLKEINDNMAVDADSDDRVMIDAYSAVVGEAKIKCDLPRSSNAQVTAVGGDFFYFHDFKLASGAYFTENDLMQDGAVIDRTLAWRLYGSDNIIGLNIYINGVKCFISGVVNDPETKIDQHCAGDTPRVYVTYNTASSMKRVSESGDLSNDGDSFKNITCYDCVLPEPVKNFGINTVKKVFENTYGDKISIVNNSKRFSPKTRAKAFKKLSESVIRDNSIKYPYWENASRMYEFKATICYGIRRYMFIIPVLTLIGLVYKGILAYNKNKKTIKRKIIEFVRSRIHKRSAASGTPKKGITS